MSLSRVGTVHSDVGQSLVMVTVFLVILSVVLFLVAYLEPGSAAKPLQKRRRLTRRDHAPSAAADRPYPGRHDGAGWE